MRATRTHGWLKSLDRYVGIPAVAATWPLRIGRRFDRTRVERIAVMKTAAIGDTILLSGPLRDVRDAFPNAELAMVTGSDNAGVVPLLPVGVDRHVIVSPNEPLRAIRAVRRLHADVMLDFGSWPRFDAMLAALSGARWRVGFRTRGQARHFGFDHTVEHLASRHELDNYRALVSSIGVRSALPPRMDAPRTLAADRFPPGPYIVFHPWSGGFRHEYKEWPADRWVELATRLGDDWHFLVSSGPHDVAQSQSLVDALARVHRRAAVARYALPELADVFTKAAAVVSVNTGVMHLAAAIGAPTVSLEGPVPTSRWGPVGPRVASVVTEYPGCGYLNLGFEYDGYRADCMNGVSVDAVHAAVAALLGATS